MTRFWPNQKKDNNHNQDKNQNNNNFNGLWHNWTQSSLWLLWQFWVRIELISDPFNSEMTYFCFTSMIQRFVFSLMSKFFKYVQITKNSYIQLIIRKEKLIWVPKNLMVTLFRHPGTHFGFCRQCSLAGGERGAPAALGWYSELWHKRCLDAMRTKK